MKERLQLTRRECLLQLYGAQVMAITPGFVRRRIRREVPDLADVSETEIRNALFFLQGQKFADEIQDNASGEVRYRITSAGILEYEKAEA